jgi:hypothetical protein
MPAPEIQRWCEIVAAMKVRTTNKKGRHLSTVRTLQLLTEHGVDTPDGFQKLAPGRLTASTINRHLKRLGYDHERMIRQPPAVRYQTEHSNALWHFDMSPSDLKQLKGQIAGLAADHLRRSAASRCHARRRSNGRRRSGKRRRRRR